MFKGSSSTWHNS